MTPPRYYKTLGVFPGADGSVIRSAYLALARQHHPDRGGDAAEFQRVKEAYEVLSSESKRKAYDALLKLTTEPCPLCNGTGQTWHQHGFTRRVARPCRQCGGSGSSE